MFYEVETDLQGVALGLASMALLNYHDARRDPAIKAELLRRCTGLGGWKYELDRDGDRWSTFAPLWSRAVEQARVLGVGAEEHPIVADCEDLTAAYAAAILLLRPRTPVDVAVTQPKPGVIAHAYTVVSGKIEDFSVKHGMRPPREGFFAGPSVRVNLNRLIEAIEWQRAQ